MNEERHNIFHSKCLIGMIKQKRKCCVGYILRIIAKWNKCIKYF
jgi:hypothetical protein